MYVHALVNLSRADSRLATSQWEMPLQSNRVSHWLVANLESALWSVISALSGGMLLIWHQAILLASLDLLSVVIKLNVMWSKMQRFKKLQLKMLSVTVGQYFPSIY